MLRMRLSDVAGGVGAENKGEKRVNERFWSSSEGCIDPADCSFDFDRLTLLVGTCDIELQQQRDEVRKLQPERSVWEDRTEGGGEEGGWLTCVVVAL